MRWGGVSILVKCAVVDYRGGPTCMHESLQVLVHLASLVVIRARMSDLLWVD